MKMALSIFRRELQMIDVRRNKFLDVEWQVRENWKKKGN